MDDGVPYLFSAKNRGMTPSDEENKITKDHESVLLTKLATVKNEVSMLRQRLIASKEYRENLEVIVQTILSKQEGVLTEMSKVKEANLVSRNERLKRREHCSMMRNVIKIEVNKIKRSLEDLTKILEDNMRLKSNSTATVNDARKKYQTLKTL